MAGLTNDDFRKLLSTPMVKSGGGGGGGGGGAATTGEGEKKKRKFYKPKEAASTTTTATTSAGVKGSTKEEKPKYRDRAAERRDGVDEYEEAVEGVDTKYLGGDVEHTHLVKGLDVVLLEKIRQEQERKRRALEEEERRSRASDALHQSHGQTGPAVDSLAYRISQILNEDASTRGPSAAAALFAPGRMAYLFELSSEVELPTKQMRASMTTSNKSRKSVAFTPQPLVDEVANVLTYGAGGAARAKRDSILKAAHAVPVVPVEAPKPPRNKEDDIFGDASDDDDGANADASAALGGMQKGQAYFGSLYSHLRTDSDAPEQVPAHLQALKRKVEAAAKAEEKKLAVQKKKEEEELERSKAVASRESGAKGGFQSYFQRRETDLAPKESKFSDADLEFDMSSKAPTKYSKVIVEEDDEMDDQAVISSFKEGLEVFEGVLNKKKGGKRARKGKEKVKLNQDLDKIAKVLKDKRDDVDELLGREAKKPKDDPQ